MHLKEGYKLHKGKYQLLSVIGEGGFSLTYKGSWKTEVQGSLGTLPTQVPVCIKEYFFKDYCLREESSCRVITNSMNGKEIFDSYKEQLVKEAKILSEVHHPNIVNVLEAFKQNNTVYIVMEFISGQSLKQKQEEFGVFSEAELLDIVYKIGQALQFIHDKNILHLDIKPSNILMDSRQNPILIDFGISKRYDLSDQQETSTSILAVSKGYAPIEQYDSEGMQAFSPCPDIYSLGATMYYLLTGQVPTESILRSTKGLESPRNLNPEISENTEAVILKAMSLHSSDRYQSMLEMITALGYDPEKHQVTALPLEEQDSDRTELVFQSKKTDFFSNQEDETVVHMPTHKSVSGKSKKRWLYLSSLLLLIVVFVVYMYGRMDNSSFDDIVDQPEVDQSEAIYSQHYGLGVNAFSKRNFSQAREEFNEAIKYKKTSEALSYLLKIDSLTSLIQEPGANSLEVELKNLNLKKDQFMKDEKVENSSITDYEHFFDLALEYYKKENYSDAKKNFQKAASLNKSIEVEKYIKLCDTELDKKGIDKIKDLYELKMKLGNFDVARKKSNGLYGAIDKNGNEKVPCKYLSSDQAGENRAFLRQDNSLYDIYDPNGTLIQEAVSVY